MNNKGKILYQSEKGSYLRNVVDLLKKGEPLKDEDYFKIINLNMTDISWDLFYALIDNPHEKAQNYWTSAIIATKLMTPYLITQKEKLESIHFSDIGQDFEQDTIIKIQGLLAAGKFDKRKSHFAKWVKDYIHNLSYSLNREGSAYFENKYGKRNNSLEGMAERLEDEDMLYNYISESSFCDYETDSSCHMIETCDINYDKELDMFKDDLSDAEIYSVVAYQKFLGTPSDFVKSACLSKISSNKSKLNEYKEIN